MKKITAVAPVNIALIKYWGKENEEEVIPYNSSLSMTLDNLYTITSIIESSEGFSFYLNDIKQSKTEEQKVYNFLTHFASPKELDRIEVISQNFVPTAAGLASSASGYAALALAANSYFNTNLNMTDLASITRKGSGSACRSLYGGFVAWEKNGKVYEVNSKQNDFVMICVLIEESKKRVSSRVAMKRTVLTSPLFPSWVKEANQDFLLMKDSLECGNIEVVGELTEKSARIMHASMLAANPPISYIKTESIKIWELVHNLRSNRIYAYATMDAGPNVKILTNEENKMKVIQSLEENNFHKFFVSKIGKGARIIEE